MLKHCLRPWSNAIRCSPQRSYNLYHPHAKSYSSQPPHNPAENDDDLHRIPPLLDFQYIVDNAESVEANMRKRNYESDCVHNVKQLYLQRNQLERESEHIRTERDRVNQLIRQATSKELRQQYIGEAKEWKDRLKGIDDQRTTLDAELVSQALLIPNHSHPEVPIGPEDNATVLSLVGQKRQAEFPLLDHLSIAEHLDMVDFQQAAFVTGSKWYYLKNDGVWLEFALIQYALEKAAQRGFKPVITPDVVRTSIAHGCGFQPRKKEASQIYDVTTPSTAGTTAPKLCLAGTAEIPLAGMFAQKILKEDDLPQRIVGYGHAFRAEAGHGSAEERGLYRVHQFSKVELFAVSTPDKSESMLQEFREFQEELFADLGLCFRVLDMPTEELGASAYRKYDIEAWMPGKNGWGEISSTSNCTDYQARRLNIRYLSSEFKEKVGAKDVRVPWHIKEKWVNFCHTLNGTAIAVPRIIVALLETHQNADGSVNVPESLRKWMPSQAKVLYKS